VERQSLRNVRFDFDARNREVRFTPVNRHRQIALAGPKSANFGREAQPISTSVPCRIRGCRWSRCRTEVEVHAQLDRIAFATQREARRGDECGVLARDP
jgi:hypothetical protein